MNEQKYIRNKQKIVIGSSGIILMIIIFLWIKSGYYQEWKNHQNSYNDFLKRIADSLELNEYIIPEQGIYEYDLVHFNRIDRCGSCHIGMEDPLMENYPQPYGMHPGNYLEDHPVSDFGCTMCHGGQGRAMNKKDAHGIDPDTHWPKPILSQPYIQASCGKCHLTVFDPMQHYEGTGTFRHGQEIFSREGCLGCHKARGAGGIIGPDLTEQGEKTRHEYNFQNIAGEQSISNWLKEHFMDPETVSPGSQMLKVELPEEELDALATFVMGLSKPDMPVDYFSVEMLKELKGIRELLPGPEVYSFTCSSCHGKSGEGKDYEEYKTGVPSIMNPDFLRVASLEFVYFTVLKGRSQKQMPAWTPDISGFMDGELKLLSQYVKTSFNKEWSVPLSNPLSGSHEQGRILFENNCMTCHGENGSGGLAVALNQKDFLNRAPDDFILNTLANGRRNTAMPAWPKISESGIRDLLSFMRSWHAGPVISAVQKLPQGNSKKGEILYHYNCSRCHGVNGEGNTGPALINRDFLEAAPDHYIVETVAEGRNHTAMFGWSTDLYNQEKLDVNDITDIIAYMEETAAKAPDYIYAGPNPGNKKTGKDLYLKHCSDCHGDNGEGITAPALHNQEFLSAASNGYMLATITVGRGGTRMPGWGYENEEYPLLIAKERQDIVAYIRSWQRIRIGF